MLAERLSQYRIMWVFVFYDLPTETEKQRKAATEFRKLMLKDGFTMFQFSMYIRPCASRENADVHTKRVKQWLPAEGHVVVMSLTDKQFGMMEIFYGREPQSKPEEPDQLTLF
jgi:CRISPR-associated protein Cas2